MKKITNSPARMPISQKLPSIQGGQVKPSIAQKPSLGSFAGAHLTEGMSRAIGLRGLQRPSLAPPPGGASKPSLGNRPHFPALMQKLQGAMAQMAQKTNTMSSQFGKISSLFGRLADLSKMDPMRGGGVRGLPMLPSKPKGPQLDSTLNRPGHHTFVRKAMPSRINDGGKGSGHGGAGDVNTYGQPNGNARTPVGPQLQFPRPPARPNMGLAPTQVGNGGKGQGHAPGNNENGHAQMPTGLRIDTKRPDVSSGPVVIHAQAKAMPAEIHGKGDGHAPGNDNAGSTAPAPNPGGNTNIISPNGPGGGFVLNPGDFSSRMGARADTIDNKGDQHILGDDTQTYNEDQRVDQNPTDYARFEQDFFSLLQNLSGNGFFSI